MHEVFHSFPPTSNRESPPNGEPQVAGNEEGDWHNKACMEPKHTTSLKEQSHTYNIRVLYLSHTYTLYTYIYTIHTGIYVL